MIFRKESIGEDPGPPKHTENRFLQKIGLKSPAEHPRCLTTPRFPTEPTLAPIAAPGDRQPSRPPTEPTVARPLTEPTEVPTDRADQLNLGGRNRPILNFWPGVLF